MEKIIHMVLEKNLQSTDNLGFATYILLYNLLLYWLNALKRAYVPFLFVIGLEIFFRTYLTITMSRNGRQNTKNKYYPMSLIFSFILAFIMLEFSRARDYYIHLCDVFHIV